MEAMSEGVLKSLGVSCCLEWSILEAKEAARGIMVFWDVRVLQCFRDGGGAFFMSCKFKNFIF